MAFISSFISAHGTIKISFRRIQLLLDICISSPDRMYQNIQWKQLTGKWKYYHTSYYQYSCYLMYGVTRVPRQKDIQSCRAPIIGQEHLVSETETRRIQIEVFLDCLRKPCPLSKQNLIENTCHKAQRKFAWASPLLSFTFTTQGLTAGSSSRPTPSADVWFSLT